MVAAAALYVVGLNNFDEQNLKRTMVINMTIVRRNVQAFYAISKFQLLDFEHLWRESELCLAQLGHLQ